MHQISRRHSQAPFKKVKGQVQLVLFHPTKPHFFVAVRASPCPAYWAPLTLFSQTQRYVRMYNLAEQTLLKTLTPGIRWISSMDVHPSGDHLIVGGYDRKLCWFDLELSDKPYKILRYVTRFLANSPSFLFASMFASVPLPYPRGRCRTYILPLSPCATSSTALPLPCYVPRAQSDPR